MPSIRKPNSNLSDQDKLVEIIETLKTVLKNIDASREIIVDGELRVDLHQAWLDLGSTFDRLQDSLRKTSTKGLSAAGLSGKQFRPKHFGFMSSYYRLNGRGGIHRVKGVLKWGKIILGSLLSLTPVIKEAAEIIKEYVEAAELGIERAEEP